MRESPRPPGPKTAPILAGCEYDYSPFCIIRENNQADGFAVELLRAALKAVGREVTFKAAPWAELKQDLAEGRLQALPMVARTPEREGLFDFTFPYLTMHGAIVVREDNTDIHGPADLKGKRVAVLQEDIAHEYLRRANHGAVIVPLPSFAAAMGELSAGKHDAVVIQKLLAFQLIKEAGLKNLRIVGSPLTGYTQSSCLAVRKGDKELLGLLNEGLSIVLADGTFRRLHAKWFSPLEAVGRIKSRIVVGGDYNYPPYEFLDKNGQPAGYNVDLTRAIARQMGLSVDIHLGHWSEVRQGLDRGQVDLVHGMFYSAERDQSFDFSPPHALIQHVVVVRAGSPEITDMSALAGKSILVMAGDIMHDLAAKIGYEKQLVPVATQEEALRLLAAGRHDCALVAKVPALFWIQEHGWRNLVVSAQPVLSAEFCYAVPHGKEELLSVFSEGLAALKKTGEYRAIQTKWLGPYEPSKLEFWIIVRYVLIGTLPLGALLAGSLLWSRSLKAQVRRRTEQLQAETEVSRKTAEALRKAEEQLRKHAENLEKTVQERTARLQETIGDLEHFSYSITHDLRAPLRAMGSFASMLMAECADCLVPAHKDYLRRISVAAKRMDQLIVDSLDYSKAVRQELSLVPVDAEQLLRGMLESYPHLQSPQADIHIVGKLPLVLGNEAGLTQCFSNLLGNAVKFVEPGKTPQLRIWAEARDSVVRLWFEDNGIGIPRGCHERIFGMFQKVNRSYEGTGIGLALVRKVSERMGGKVGVESELGQGSRFWLDLPPAAPLA